MGNYKHTPERVKLRQQMPKPGDFSENVHSFGGNYELFSGFQVMLIEEVLPISANATLEVNF